MSKAKVDLAEMITTVRSGVSDVSLRLLSFVVRGANHHRNAHHTSPDPIALHV